MFYSNIYHLKNTLLHNFPASDLAKEQKLNFGDDIASQLRLARKKRFSVQEERRIAQEIELHSYLNRLIEKDREEQINNIKNEEADSSTSKPKIEEIESKCVSYYLRLFTVLNMELFDLHFKMTFLFKDTYMTELNQLFSKVDERRRVSVATNLLYFYFNLYIILEA